jgi:hypothetical protein
MKKPAKPTPDFPLFPHGNGQWAKKEGGRTRYYGPWVDPDGALQRYLVMTPEASDGRQQVVSEQGSVPDCPPPVKVRKQKPTKPHPDFPLYAHASGRWAKKIRGETRFFGPWEDPEGSLERWLEQKDDLLSGNV